MSVVPTAARFRWEVSCTVKQITGPEFIFRFNEFNAAQVNFVSAPGYSTGQTRRALEDTFKKVMPAGAGFDYSGMFLPGAGGR